ncbi:MAG: FecR domain-containing protein [Deltaproteobacteria bacterium]|nr:FecR domain-containing protein [Deltaproteobacteria bacterium]
MNRLEELLSAYENQTMSEQERDELKALLAEPANRATLVDFLHTNEMLVTFFSEQEKGIDAQSVREESVEEHSSESSLERRSAIVKALPVWNAALAAALVLAIGTLVVFQRIYWEPVLATVSEVQGDVQADRKDHRIRVKQGTQIKNHSRLLVRGSGSSALLTFADGSWTRIGGDARIGIQATDAGHRIHVSQGHLLADLKKQKPNQPFVFTTKHASATVLGTRIWLQARTEATVLRVDRGRVRMTRLSDGQSLLVQGGNTAVASADATSPFRTQATSFVATIQTQKDKQRPLAQLSFDTRENESAVSGRELRAVIRLQKRDGRHAGLGDYLVEGRKGAAFQANQTVVAIDLEKAFAPQRLSLSLWLKVTAAQAAIDHPVLIDKEAAENKAGFSLRGFDRDTGRRSNQVRFRIWTDQGLEQLSCRVDKPDGWNHVAVTFDGRVLKMYQNGQQVDALELGDVRLVHSDKQITVGRFIGLIDEVRLDDRALSDEQVERLAAE